MSMRYGIDIVFVILHYNVYNETINCVKSIMNNIDNDNYHIVIVDNCSPNKSGEILKTQYADSDKCTVILNEDNSGFAKGNNVGIDYARKILNPKYVCCLNNDTLLEQTDFYKILEKEYNTSQAAVIGPKVILKNGEIQRFNGELYPLAEYRRQLENHCVNKSMGIYQNTKKILKQYKFIQKLLVIKNGLYKRNEIRFFNERHENIVLHGCCLIFTPVFFSVLEGFDPRTFMFREEELLYILLKKNNLSNVYCPQLFIRHLEDAATDSQYKTDKEKNAFLSKNQIESLKILINELETSNKDENEKFID